MRKQAKSSQTSVLACLRSLTRSMLRQESLRMLFFKQRLLLRDDLRAYSGNTHPQNSHFRMEEFKAYHDELRAVKILIIRCGLRFPLIENPG